MVWMADRMEWIVNGKKETVISVELMRRSDAYTIANFVPGAELMYRAAMGVFHAVDWHGRIAILTGGGNNGGDGFALACILADHGIFPDVFRISERLTEDGLHYFAQATQKGVCIRPFQESTALTHYDILVDCILGTGFSGMVRGLARNAIQSVNVADGFVVSVDIN
ncbi:MAG: hypothetical protein EOM66_06915, partial [Clostridia bacterium]|nr:hypothetical protein [Clostridia bacterium]